MNFQVLDPRRPLQARGSLAQQGLRADLRCCLQACNPPFLPSLNVLTIRVTLIFLACQPGLVEMENLRGNGRRII